MSSFEITAQQKYAYQTGRGWHPDTVPHVLAEALQAQYAARLKTEFEKEHYENREWDCVSCRDYRTRDPRHDWTIEQWLAEADRRLREP